MRPIAILAALLAASRLDSVPRARSGPTVRNVSQEKYQRVTPSVEQVDMQKGSNGGTSSSIMYTVTSANIVRLGPSDGESTANTLDPFPATR